MAHETTLAEMTRKAKLSNRDTGGVWLTCTRANSTLRFRISDGVAALVTRYLYEKDGWEVTEKGDS